MTMIGERVFFLGSYGESRVVGELPFNYFIYFYFYLYIFIPFIYLSSFFF